MSYALLSKVSSAETENATKPVVRQDKKVPEVSGAEAEREARAVSGEDRAWAALVCGEEGGMGRPWSAVRGR